jgi:serine/threonine-protein kinase
MIAEAEAFEGKYEILEKIREGGMGAVYKVRHRLLDEIRVIKVIRPHLSTSPEMGERFLREARLAIRVRHPNIAQLHDFSIDPDGTAYIVMELIDGLSLADVLARAAPLPPGLTLEIARGALSAIGYLHRREMIHRDVSPDNLMLGRDEEDGGPRVTLLDLGIAKSLAGSSALTSTGAFLGKPRYASPEHFGAEGLAAVGPRSDLYSLGIVLYELLTGVCPVQGRDMSSWIAGHLFRPPVGFAESDPEGRVPADLQAVLLKVLAKAPADRFASAEEMAAALAPIRARFPVEPSALERALGGPPANAPPAALPSPGTTQEALDRQFAPLQTPPPRPAPAATLVLHSLEPLPPPEPAHAPPLPAEGTQVLPRPPAVEDRARPARRLIPVLAGLLLVALSLGIWSMVRSREPAPPPPVPVAAAPTPAPAVPERAPEPVVATPPPPAAESTPVAETPAPTPEPPAEPRVRSAPEPPPAPRKRPEAEAPKQETRRERPSRSEPPAVPATSEPPSEPPAAQAPVEPAPEPVVPPAPPPSQPARILSAPKPEYPRKARGSGIHAVIIVAVRVDTKGLVDKVEVRRALAKRGSNGQPPTAAQAQAFQDAAVEAARKALFQPATKDGKPVSWMVELVEDFLPE